MQNGLRHGSTKRWDPTFGSRHFSSIHSVGTGRNQHLLIERFGPAAFAIAPVLDGNRLRLIPRQWPLFGIPMPRAMLPGGRSFETERDGRFHFDIEI